MEGLWGDQRSELMSFVDTASTSGIKLVAKDGILVQAAGPLPAADGVKEAETLCGRHMSAESGGATRPRQAATTTGLCPSFGFLQANHHPMPRATSPDPRREKTAASDRGNVDSAGDFLNASHATACDILSTVHILGLRRDPRGPSRHVTHGERRLAVRGPRGRTQGKAVRALQCVPPCISGTIIALLLVL